MQLKAADILEPLWKQYPNHPGLPHYIIHAYDHPPLAAKALDAASRYMKIAPSAPHALHMPSHTFTRLGHWKESVETNIASEQVALEQNVVGEAVHAMDYQIYAYLQMARDTSALAVVQRTPGTIAKLDVNAMGGAAPGAAGVYASAAVPARYALERGAWAEAAALTPESSAFPHADAISHYARALGAARSGNPGAAHMDIEQLVVLRDKLAAMKDEYWREQVDIQRRVALAWATWAEGRRVEGIDVLRTAAASEDATDKRQSLRDPWHLRASCWARCSLNQGRKGSAGRIRGHDEERAGSVPRHVRRGPSGGAVGEAAKARGLYEALLNLAQSASTERPEVQHARAFLNRF